MPKFSEVAELTVEGRIFRDWDSVMVRHSLKVMPPIEFRFTCSESLPISKNWGTLQIRPGDKCTVKLAGILAFTGYVGTRQVFVDAVRHYIEIKGVNSSSDVASIVATAPGMELKDKNFKEITETLLKPTGIPFKVVNGTLPTFKFPRYSIRPGATIWECLNELSLIIGCNMTSDPQGDLVASMGPEQGSGGADSVVEGKNMLDGRELIATDMWNGKVRSAGSFPGNDKMFGTKVASEPKVEGEGVKSLTGDRMSSQIMLTQPAWSKEHLEGRVNADRNWQQQDGITVIATVQGWRRPSGGLWKPDQMVHVKSPMLIMDQDLQAKSVTFMQNNEAGSRTVLELCNPIAIGGHVPKFPTELLGEK